MIKVSYRSCDGCRSTRPFKTLKGAQAYAQKMVGEHPDIGSSYAVSFDGIGVIEVRGATLQELFPPAAPGRAYKDELIEHVFELLTLAPIKRAEIIDILEAVKAKVAAIPTKEVR